MEAIRKERRRRADRVVVTGLLNDQDVVFRVDVRRWVASSKLTGEDMGVPVVEIAELEVRPGFQGLRSTFLVLCEALTEALILSDSDPSHLIAVVAENPSVQRRLEYRDDFRQLTELPLPFVITVEDAVTLRNNVCR